MKKNIIKALLSIVLSVLSFFSNAANLITEPGTANGGLLTATKGFCSGTEYCLRLDGIDDYYALTGVTNSPTNLGMVSHNFTVAAWVRINPGAYVAATTPGSPQYQSSSTIDLPVLGQDNTVATPTALGTNGLHLTLRYAPNSSGFKPHMGFYPYDSSVGDTTGNTIVKEGEWTYVTWKFELEDPSNINGGYKSLWVNGKLDTFGNYLVSLTGTSALNIGFWRGSDNVAKYFNGQIRSVVVYNTALSESEISKNYQSTQIDIPQTSETGINYLSSGANYDGEMKGGLLITPEDDNVNSMYFDGVDDYIALSSNMSLANTSMTVESWVKLAPGASAGERPIFGSSSNSSPAAMRFSIVDGKPRFGFGSTNYRIDGPTTLSENRWYHIAGRFELTSAANKTGTLSLFVDGQQVASATGKPAYSGTANNLMIGKTSTALFMKGRIRDVRIYNYKRSDEEIGLSYRLNNIAAGTKNNNALITDSSNASSQCDGLSNCLVLDGIEDFLALSATDKLNLSGSSFTTQGWVYLDDSAQFSMDQPVVGAADGMNFGMGSGVPLFKFNATSSLSGSTSLYKKRWYHMAWRYDRATQTQSLFVDGIKAATDRTGTSALLASQAVMLGKTGTATVFPSGKLYDMRIYGYARSDSQITNSYNNTKAQFSVLTAPTLSQSIQAATQSLADANGWVNVNELLQELRDRGFTDVDSLDDVTNAIAYLDQWRIYFNDSAAAYTSSYCMYGSDMYGSNKSWMAYFTPFVNAQYIKVVAEDLTSDTYVPCDHTYANVEADVVSVPASNSAPGYALTQFKNVYDRPPFIFVMPTNDGSTEPATLEVGGISAQAFNVAGFEPRRNYSGATAIGAGTVAMKAPYLAVERSKMPNGISIQVLPDGTIIESGSINTRAFRGNVTQFPTGQSWAHIDFKYPFSSKPVVLTQIQTHNNTPRTPGITVDGTWLTTATNNLVAKDASHAAGMDIALQRSEVSGNPVTTLNADEEIAYVAIALPTGTSTSFTGSLTSNTNQTVTLKGWATASAIITDACTLTNYPTSAFASGTMPLVFATLTTTNGADGGWLRTCATTNTSASIRVQEDQFSDAETTHSTAESGSFLAFSGGFGLTVNADNTSANRNTNIATSTSFLSAPTLALSTTWQNIGASLSASTLSSWIAGMQGVELSTGANGTGSRTCWSGTGDLVAMGIASARVSPAGGLCNPDKSAKPLAGDFSVSPSTGSATYSMPLTVPPATANFKPEIAFVYNSQSANDLMGDGWSVSTGASTVYRCNQTISQDGYFDEPDYDQYDKFCLDGQPLIAITGVYGANNTEYRTENENFNKIVSYASGNNGPTSFKVWSPNGTVREYGVSSTPGSDASISGGPSNSNIYQWYLNKVTDVSGNYYTFSYDYHSSGEQHLISIQYTGNTATSLQPNKQIYFRYDDNRPDALAGYQSEEKRVMTHLLSSVETYINCADTSIAPCTGGTLSFNYQLAYRTSPFNAQTELVAVTQCNGLNACAPATTFTWNNNNAPSLVFVSNSTLDASIGDSNSAYRVPIDINQDGNTDIVAFTGSGSTINYRSYLSNGNGGYSAQSLQTLTVPSITTSFASPTAVNPLRFVVANFDHVDGDDIALIVSSVSGSQLQETAILMPNKGDGTFGPTSGQTYAELGGQLTASGNYLSRYAAMDVAGDGNIGLARFAYVNSGTDYYSTKLTVRAVNDVNAGFAGTSISLNGSSKALPQNQKLGDYTWYTVSNSMNEGYGPQVMDVNGDGLSDIAIVTKVRITSAGGVGPRWDKITIRPFIATVVGVFAESVATSPITTNDLLYQMPGAPFSVVQLNANGDNLQDMALVALAANGGAYIVTLYGNGVGFDYTSTAGDPIQTSATTTTPFIALDLDRTGIDEIATMTSTGALKTWRITNASSNGATASLMDLAISGFGEAQQLMKTDNNTELTAIGKSSGIPYYSLRNPVETMSGIETIADGAGNSTIIHYSTLRDNTTYAKDSNAVFPVKDIINDTTVVKSSETSNGIGGLNQTTYFYRGLKFNSDAQQMLGYREFESSDTVNDRKTTQTYNQDITNHQAGRPSHTVVRTISSNNIVQDTTHSYLVQTFGNTKYQQRFFVTPEFVTTKSYVDDSQGLSHWINTTQKTFSYYPDNGQLMVASTITYYGGNENSSATAHSASKTYSYQAVDTNKWLLNLVNAVNDEVFYSTNGAINGYSLKTTSYFYTNGLVSREVVNPENGTADPAGTSAQIDTTYVRNTFGEITSTTTVSDAPTSTLIEEFDARGEFKINKKQTDALIEYFSYDPHFGNVTSKTDVDGFVTNITYDNFGREMQIVDASGHTTTFQYDACGSMVGCEAGEVYRMQITTTGAPTEQKFLDMLGRIVREQHTDLANNWINVRKKYDNRGRLSMQSVPFHDNPEDLWHTYSYDTFDRPTGTLYADRTSDSISYGVNASGEIETTLTDQNGHVLKRYSDGLGREVKTTDANNNSVTHIFDARGRKTRTTEVGGYLTTMSYDGYGTITSVSTPDTGTQTTFNNALGRPVLQTLPDGQKICVAYDAIGREIKRVGYYQGTQNDAKNQCANPGSSAETVITTYDSGVMAKGKISQIQKTNGIGTVLYSESYTYDASGRLIGAVTQYDGKTFMRSTAYGADGLPSSVSYPSGLTLNTRYDEFGYGYKKELFRSDGGHSDVYVHVNGMSLSGQIEHSTLGNGIDKMELYSTTNGRLFSQSARGMLGDTLHSMSYTYDNAGNLLSRQDNVRHSTETFTYDALNRLTSWNLSDTGSVSYMENYSYDAGGNLLTKGLLGYQYNTYTYSASDNCVGNASPGPHAVRKINLSSYCYDRRGNVIAVGTSKSFTYNLNNQPTTITSGGSTVTLDYSPSGARLKQTSGSATTYYLGKDYEYQIANGVITEKHYVGGVAIVTKTTTNGVSSENTDYFLTDHLGSITTLLNSTGVIKEKYRFDPWGVQTVLTDDTTFATPTLGFTGHLTLSSVGLIHMGGRVYDPAIGRFLSADPYVQAPENSQSYNRYSYVMNNPLTLTDPSGFKWWKKILPAAIQVAVGATAMAAGAALCLTGVGCGVGIALGVSGLLMAFDGSQRLATMNNKETFIEATLGKDVQKALTIGSAVGVAVFGAAGTGMAIAAGALEAGGAAIEAGIARGVDEVVVRAYQIGGPARVGMDAALQGVGRGVARLPISTQLEAASRVAAGYINESYTLALPRLTAAADTAYEWGAWGARQVAQGAVEWGSNFLNVLAW